MSLLIVLLVLAGVGYRITTPEERAQLRRTALAHIGRARKAGPAAHPELEQLRELLRARTSRALVTPALVVVNATVFVLMLLGSGWLSDPEALVGWGASVGHRTTMGEWWRLVSAMFVHAGMLHLLVNIAALVQAGLIVERLVGPVSFAVVYLAAGVFASLVSVTVYPVGVSAGASGAICGVYGVLFAWSISSALQRAAVPIPLVAARGLLPVAAMFMAYNILAGHLQTVAELTGLTVGFACGMVLTGRAGERRPLASRLAVAGATVIIALAAASHLRAVTDVRPQIEEVVALEARTAAAYESEVDRFRRAMITADALADVIEHAILPELQAARARLQALGGVPPEHRPLVADAEEYLRLRQESWQLRSEALHAASLPALREADRSERVSLEAFHRIQRSGHK